MNSAWASSHQNKPPDNASMESFNGLGKECLDATWFRSLDNARGKLEARQRHHNESRRESFLTSAPPAKFARRCWLRPALAISKKPAVSTSEQH